MSTGEPPAEAPDDEWFEGDRSVRAEADWLSCTQPGPLIDVVNGQNAHRFAASRRKFFLFGAGCVRRAWRLLTRPESRAAVEAAEAFADGLLTEDEVGAVPERAELDWRDWPGGREDPGFYAASAAALLAIDRRGRYGNAEVVPSAVSNVSRAVAGLSGAETASGPWWDAQLAESRAQSDLFRCVMGNPFRPVAFSPEWRTPTAVAIARGMYESRDFSAMPILADALEEAGCPEPTVLGHCRDPKGLHARGCWVVDLVLDREPPPVVE